MPKRKEEKSKGAHELYGVPKDKLISQIILILRDNTPDKPFKLKEIADLDTYQKIGSHPTGSVIDIYRGESGQLYLFSANKVGKSPEKFSEYIQSLLRQKYGDRFSVVNADSLFRYVQSSWFEFIDTLKEDVLKKIGGREVGHF
jgi:hypothetical protein